MKLSRACRSAGGILLALLQTVLLAGSGLLHAHPEGGLPIDRLPAEYHHHDFQLDAGSEALPVPADVCIGCRLDKTPAATAAAPALLSPAARFTAPRPQPVSPRPQASNHLSRPRAPPAG